MAKRGKEKKILLTWMTKTKEEKKNPVPQKEGVRGTKDHCSEGAPLGEAGPRKLGRKALRRLLRGRAGKLLRPLADRVPASGGALFQ